MDFEGLTGRVHFDGGVRKDVKLDVLELAQSGLKKVSDISRIIISDLNILIYYTNIIDRNLYRLHTQRTMRL